MFDKRRELKNKKHDAQGRSQYREINNKIRKAIKQAKENWIEEQCEEIDINLTKNNTNRAYQVVKDLTTTKKGRASTIQDKTGKSLTEDQEILTCWTEYCSDLYNHETQGDCAVLTGPHSTNQDNLPIFKRRSWGSSEITQEKKIGRGGQHTCRTCTSWRRSDDWCSSHHLQQNLAYWRMANPVDTFTYHHTTKEREPANVPKLPHNQPH